MHSVPQAALRRNVVERQSDHHDGHHHIELTAGGREIWRRTHRPISTCNLLAAFAGIGVREEAL